MSKREINAANRMMIYALMLASSFTFMRAAGDSLFLGRVGSEYLAILFVCSGIATMIVAWIWVWWNRNATTERSLKSAGVCFALLTFGFWLIVPWLEQSVLLLGLICLLTEIKACINTINIVAVSNDVLGSHSNRSVWARVGLGVPLAFIFAGSLVGMEPGVLTVRDWLLASCLLDLFAGFSLGKLDKIRVPVNNAMSLRSARKRARAGKQNKTVKSAYVNSQRFRILISTLVGAKVATLTFVAFYWKSAASDFFGDDEQQLARYFGIFYAFTGIATLVIQTQLTERFLVNNKLRIPIFLMPFSLILLSIFAIVAVGALLWLVTTTTARSLEAWRRSVHDSTINMLYTRVKRKRRRAIISTTSALVKPFAEVFVSLILLLGGILIHQLAFAIALGTWTIAGIVLLRLISHDGLSTGNTEKELASKNSRTLKQLVPRLIDN